MLFTGCDYVIYSDTPLGKIRGAFENELKKKWHSFIVEIDENEDKTCLELFFSQDALMLKHHDEHGYNSNENGEACFMLIADRIVRLNLSINVPSQISVRNPSYIVQEYESKIISNNTWEYTLVLPDLITEHLFSKHIYDMLINILNSDE